MVSNNTIIWVFTTLGHTLVFEWMYIFWYCTPPKNPKYTTEQLNIYIIIYI